METSVFNLDRNTVTNRNVLAGATSHVPLTNAQGGQITSPTFVPGIDPGVDVSYVEGTRIYFVKGESFEQVTGDFTTIIEGHESHNVDTGRGTVIKGTDTRVVTNGNDNLSIQGNSITTVGGNYQRTVTGVAMRSVMGGEFQNEVASWLRTFGTVRWQYGGADLKTSLLNMGIQAAKVDVNAAKSDMSVIELKLGALQTDLKGGKFVIGAAKLFTGGVSNKMDMVGS
jgi:hypothetical protein